MGSISGIFGLIGTFLGGASILSTFLIPILIGAGVLALVAVAAVVVVIVLLVLKKKKK